MRFIEPRTVPTREASMPKANKPTGPKQNSATNAPTLYICQIERLDAWFGGRPIMCPCCGEQLSNTDPHAIVGHLLLHEPSAEERAAVTLAMANMRGWKHLLAAVKANLRAG